MKKNTAYAYVEQGREEKEEKKEKTLETHALALCHRRKKNRRARPANKLTAKEHERHVARRRGVQDGDAVEGRGGYRSPIF